MKDVEIDKVIDFEGALLAYFDSEKGWFLKNKLTKPGIGMMISRSNLPIL